MAKRAQASLHEQNRKVIVDSIRNLGGGKYRRYQVFSDWVEMLALALSNAVDKSQFDVREARYLEIAKRYAKEELTELAGLLPCLVDEFSQGQDGISFDDVLGDIFMACEFGSDCHGQFFTPYHISSLMAQMVAGTQGQDALQRRGFVRANEPTCGAGGMCVALAETMHKAGINYQQCLHVTAQDIDPVCVHMAYIQLSLLHIPAVVILGDTIKMEQRQHWLTLAHVMGGWNEKLRLAEFMDAVRSMFFENGEVAADAPPQSEPEPTTEPIPVFAAPAVAERGQLCLF